MTLFEFLVLGTATLSLLLSAGGAFRTGWARKYWITCFVAQWLGIGGMAASELMVSNNAILPTFSMGLLGVQGLGILGAAILTVWTFRDLLED